MAASARVLRDAARGAPRRRSRTRSSPGFPLRDWKRAFALVDELKAAYGGAWWFHGVRALRDPRTEAITIEVEVAGSHALSRDLPARLLALGVRLRPVDPEPASAAAG